MFVVLPQIKNSCRKILCCCTAVMCAVLLCSCGSNDELIDQKPDDTVYVTFKVDGLNQQLHDNVQAFLDTMPAIAKDRVFLFNREIRENTQKALRAFGYYHPEIKVDLPKRDDPNASEVVVSVDAGKPLFIRNCNVEILGEGADYKVFSDLLKNSSIKSYTLLDHGAYEKLKSDLRSKALSLGFFDVELLSSRIMVYTEENFADIELLIDTGKRYSFGKFITDEATDELLKPVESLMTLNEGKPFSTKEISDYHSSLTQTNFYRSIDITPEMDAIEDYKVPLKVHLERRSNNLMRVGAGFSTDEGPRMLFEWDKPLLNSDGHSMSSYAKLSQVTQNAQVVYKIPRKNPNLDYYYISASQTHTDLNDTLSDRSHLSFHYVANDTGVWRRDYSIRAEYEDYEQGSEDGYGWNLMPALQLSRRESSGGFDPRYGYSLNLDLTGATSGISDYSFFRALATFKGVISPTENTRLVMRLQQGGIFGPDSETLPPSLRFFAGGDQSIRGYGYMDEAPHNSGGLKGARYLTTGTLEYQFPIGIANSRMAVFLDAGTATDDYKDDILFGPGIGYRYVSPYGTVRVDLGFGIDNDSDSDASDIRLHFAFGPEF